MKILFWNVQRLGGGSGELKKAVIEGLLAEAFLSDVTWALLCEVTSDTELGDAPVQKQLGLAKKTQKKTSAQLGYAWIKSDLSTGTLEPLEVEDVVTYKPSGENVRLVKGGASFAAQSKRRVAYVGQAEPNGVHVFLYHANSSDKAAALVTQTVLACLNLKECKRFVLIGDLNCEPVLLLATLQANLSAFAVVGAQWGSDTYNAREGLSKTYDYCVYGGEVDCTVTTIDITHVLQNLEKKDLPDHLPIVVEIR